MTYTAKAIAFMLAIHAKNTGACHRSLLRFKLVESFGIIALEFLAFAFTFLL